MRWFPTLCAWMLVASSAGAAEFVVRPGGESRVTFLSRATVESFTGRTSALEGRITVDPDAVGDSIVARFEVDLMKLDTGIGRRNRHMHENHLETAKYPKAVFEGVTVLGPPGARLEPGRAVTLPLEGTFTIHGVSRRKRIEVVATRSPDGSRIAFQTVFQVGLSEHGISRPEFLFLKLAEQQQVSVSGIAVAAAP